MVKGGPNTNVQRRGPIQMVKGGGHRDTAGIPVGRYAPSAVYGYRVFGDKSNRDGTCSLFGYYNV